jgi:hypothetical protein
MDGSYGHGTDCVLPIEETKQFFQGNKVEDRPI